MKRIFLIVTLILLSSCLLSAQEKTKAEIRAEKQALKAEQRRIKDSIYYAQQAEQQKIYEEEQAKKNANTLLVITTFETKDNAFITLVNALYDDGYILIEKDREFYTIKTEKKDAGFARYDLNFRITEKDNKIVVQISGRAHTSFTLYGVHHQSADPLKNIGTEGSTNKVGFGEMERYANLLPHESIEYITR